MIVKEKFRILTDNNCNNLIFNSHSLYINKLDNLNVDFILLSFSDEDGQTARFIYDQFKQILAGKIQQIPSFINHTNGIFMINYHFLEKNVIIIVNNL